MEIRVPVRWRPAKPWNLKTPATCPTSSYLISPHSSHPALLHHHFPTSFPLPSSSCSPNHPFAPPHPFHCPLPLAHTLPTTTKMTSLPKSRIAAYANLTPFFVTVHHFALNKTYRVSSLFSLKALPADWTGIVECPPLRVARMAINVF